MTSVVFKSCDLNYTDDPISSNQLGLKYNHNDTYGEIHQSKFFRFSDPEKKPSLKLFYIFDKIVEGHFSWLVTTTFKKLLIELLYFIVTVSQQTIVHKHDRSY